MLPEKIYKGPSHLIMGFILIFGPLILAVPAVFAGGWVMVTLDSLPVEPSAGQALHLGFTIRQHGLTPINTAWESEPLQPYLSASNTETGQTIRVEARQEGPVGHFGLEVIFPGPGAWNWQIKAEPFGTVPAQFEPLTVLPAQSAPTRLSTGTTTNVPAGAGWLALLILIGGGGLVLAVRQKALTGRAGAVISTVGLVTLTVGLFLWPSLIFGATTATESGPTPNAEYGQALFVAKGCAACHAHTKTSYSIPGPVIGPNLTDYVPDPGYLRRWLRDPKSVRPDTQMPALTLSEAEIEALMAFLAAN